MSVVFKTLAGEERVLTHYRQILAHWPVENRQQFVATGQGETFVLGCGAQDLPPLVLLHGAQANIAVWMFDVPAWSRHFQIFAIDLIGEAGLSAQKRPPLDSDAHARWLRDVVDALGLSGPIALHGVSLGGFLALDFAKHYPARVSRLSLICPAGIGRTRPFLLKYGWLLLLGGWGRRKLRELILGPNPAKIPETARPFIALMEEIGANIRPRLEKIPQLSNLELERLTMPLQCIVGGKDVLIDSAETRERLARSVPHAKLFYHPDTPHFIPGQGQVIENFLVPGDPA